MERKGILGRKLGMTQVFSKDGKLVPVTVIEVEPNVVTQIKTVENDGYEAIQLGFDTKREKLSNKAEMGHVNKANTAPKRFFKEIRGVDISKYELGQALTCEVFEEGEMVDVSGVSKGKGYQGVIKRYHQSRGPMGHGSQYHRGVGSLGTMRPMRVFKGKKLPGHMGHVTITMQNLEVVAVIPEENVILIKGNVPGAKESLVIIRSAIKKQGVKNNPTELVDYEEKVEAVVEEAAAEETPVEETANEEVAEEAPVEETPAEEEAAPAEEETPKETAEEENNEASQEA